MTTETRLALSDITHAGIECNICRAEVLLPVTAENGLIPARCPGCNREYEALQIALVHLRAVWRELQQASGARDTVTLRIRSESPGGRS